MDLALAARLLVRPRGHLSEHPGGYWLRVAHMNGLREPRWLLNPLEPRAHSIIRSCPHCLCGADAHWRTSWLDVQRPWCDRHGTWLVDCCPACSRPLRWGRMRFLGCCCGNDLRETATVALTPEARLAVKTVPVPVLLWLGALSRHGLADKPLKKASRQTMADIAEMVECGATTTSDWPAAFFRTLDECRDSAGAGNTVSLRLLNEALPGLTRRIGKLRDIPWRTKIATAISEYVASSRTTSAPLIGRNTAGVGLPSLMKVARELGVRPERLSAALDKLPSSDAPVRRTVGGRRRRMMSPHAVFAVKKVLNGEITTKQAAKLLGLTSARVRQLVADRKLRSTHGKLDRRAVIGICKDLIDSAVVGRQPVDGVTFGYALRHWVPIDRTGLLIDAIRSGALTVYRSQQHDGPSALQLSEGQLRSWAERQPQASREWVTVPEAAEHLGLKQQVVYHLVRVGLIPIERMRADRRVAQMVRRSALDEFALNIEPLARAAARSGIDHRHGLEWAQLHGIELVSGPRIDGGRQYFARIDKASPSTKGAQGRSPKGYGAKVMRRPESQLNPPPR